MNLHANTLIEMLQGRAAERTGAGYLFTDGDRELDRLSFTELDRRARRIAAHLREHHPAGARALMLYPQSLDFVAAFFGCLYAGIVAVPAYPPDPGRLSRTLPRLESMARSAEATLVLTTTELLPFFDAMAGEGEGVARLPRYVTDRLAAEPGEVDPPAGSSRLTGDTTAFIQYTSGSVGTPKGVVVSHRNLLANLEMVAGISDGPEDLSVVSWVPLFHDMGLVIGCLTPLYVGNTCYMLSPLDFLRDPLNWLRTLSRYRATVSAAPNFAFELCVRRVAPEAREGLDLSRWRYAINSAEPVRADTMRKFQAFFAPCGFQARALAPAYGLAEATLVVTAADSAHPARIDRFDEEALGEGRLRLAAGEGGRVMVSAGVPRGEARIVIVDPETRRPHAVGEIGEIWVAGPSVAGGYLNLPEQTAATFGARLAESGEGPFLRTGDLGAWLDGQLYVTGRLKDVIILRGRNYYPQDLERTVELAHPAVRPGCIIAFSIDVRDEERLVVAAEARPGSDLASAAQAVARAVADEHGLHLHELVFLAPRGLPKTSSGKLQRRACRQGYLEETLPVIETWSGALLIEAFLRARVAAAAGVPVEALPADLSLATAGLDSLALLSVAAEVEESTGIRLELETLTGAPSVQALAFQLAADLSPQEEDLSPGPSPERGGEAKEDAFSLPLPPRGRGQGRGADAQGRGQGRGADAQGRGQGRGADAQGGGEAKEDAAADRLEPTSHIQRSIWQDHLAMPGSHTFSLALRLTGAVATAGLERALEALMLEFPLLRSTFVEREGRLFRRTHTRLEPAFQVEDATWWSEARMRDRMAEEAVRPIDVTSVSPVRVLVLEQGPGERVVQLSLHHLAYDAATVLELVGAYLEHAAGRRIEPRPQPDYQRFVAWEQGWLESAGGRAAATTWRERLGTRALELAMPGGNGAGAAFQRQVAARLPADRLDGAARAHGVTPNVLLLTGWMLALRDWLEVDAPVLGTTVSLRMEPGLARIPGPVFNYVPVRAGLAGVTALPTALREVGAAVVGALRGRRYPFVRLRAEHGGGTGSVALGLNANFNYYDVDRLDPAGTLARMRSGEGVVMGGLKAANVPIASLPVVRPYTLNLGVVRGGGGVELGLRYREGLLSAQEAAALLRRALEHLELA